MHAPSFRLRLSFGVLRATGLGLLLLVGCDWRTPAKVADAPGILDLTDYSAGMDDWRTRQADIGKLPALRLDGTEGSSIMVVTARSGVSSRWRRKVRWDAESHPVLSWTWGMNHMADSARFPRRRGPASVLAVDVTLASAFGFHKTVRYIWSARSDRGTLWASRDSWHPKVRVLRDVHDTVGVMATERIDVWKDFSELWGFTPRHQALAIAVSVQDPSSANPIEGRFGAILAHPIPEKP